MSILDLIPPTKKEPSVSSIRRQGIMLCYPFEEKRLLSWTPPYFVDPKLDGERCREEENDLLVSSELTPILSVPHIERALREIPRPSGALFDGELYSHGLSFEQIHSRVSRTVNPHPRANRIRFHVFDIWNSPRPQFRRRMELIELSKSFPPEIVLVPTRICNSLDDVLTAYEIYISEGYEGIVVRHIDNLYVPRRSTFLMKFKPKKSDIYEIVDIHEAISADGTPKRMVGSFVCRDREGNEFSVSPGHGWDDERKKKIWFSHIDYCISGTNKQAHPIIGKDVFIEYQNLTLKRKVPRFGRFPFDKNIWLEVL